MTGILGFADHADRVRLHSPEVEYLLGPGIQSQLEELLDSEGTEAAFYERFHQLVLDEMGVDISPIIHKKSRTMWGMLFTRTQMLTANGLKTIFMESEPVAT